MNRGTQDCARRWQAEAIEDGRLDGLERTSFERHVATCPTCAAERRTLRKIRDLGQRLPEDRPGEFERRRLRLEILRRSDAIVTGRGAPWLRQEHALAAAAVLFLGVSALGWSVARHGLSGDATELSNSTAFADEAGVASAATSSGASRSGQRAAERAKNSLGPPATPGDITQTQPGLRLAAAAHQVASELVDKAIEPAAAAGSASEATRLPVNPERRRFPPSTQLGSKAMARTSISLSAGTAGMAFTQAVAVFSQGAYGLAEERFLQFETRYPQDARVEDAAFLRAICHQRRGDYDGAAREASEYLRRYPAGFRRREARSMLVSY